MLLHGFVRIQIHSFMATCFNTVERIGTEEALLAPISATSTLPRQFTRIQTYLRQGKNMTRRKFITLAEARQWRFRARRGRRSGCGASVSSMTLDSDDPLAQARLTAFAQSLEQLRLVEPLTSKSTTATEEATLSLSAGTLWNSWRSRLTSYLRLVRGAWTAAAGYTYHTHRVYDCS